MINFVSCLVCDNTSYCCISQTCTYDCDCVYNLDFKIYIIVKCVKERIIKSKEVVLDNHV